ncbi:MAG: hypothetical protein VYE77_02075 [Planctomycetota bacterium]|nr:hypothetical protein [Planctomycetota bacterium]
MIIPLLSLFLVSAQDPQPVVPTPVVPAAPPGAAVQAEEQPKVPEAGERLDLVELEIGEVLEGRIVLERSNYLEIELAPGTVVGFRKSAVVAVRRGAGRLLPGAPKDALAAGDNWFVLHDATGQAVGWLHSTVSVDASVGSRLLEEWEFREGDRYFQVTVLETTGRDQRPLSCYFRERISEQILGDGGADPVARTNRVRQERIIEATVMGDVLRVRYLSGGTRRERNVPWSEDASFPLLARARNHDGKTERELTVFDPAVEELQTRRFTAVRQRRVTLEGITELVDEVVEYAAGCSNATWRDASGKVVRREISGPSLTAMPSDAATARQAVFRGEAQPPLLVVEPERRFGVWRPSSTWQAIETPPGSVSLFCAAQDAVISMALLDHLDSGETLDAAGSAVVRWFRLLQPDLEITQRAQRTFRQRSALHISARSGVHAGATRVLLVVLPWQDRFLVVRCQAPELAWDELESDFQAAIDRLELEPRAIEALLPEDEASRAKTRSATGTTRSNPRTAPANGQRPRGSVRLPRPAGGR